MSRARLAHHVTETVARLEKALERIRPAMQMDGGDIRLVGWDAAQGIVRVELTGACHGCSQSTTTMSLGVERVLKQLVPEVRAVVSESV